MSYSAVPSPSSMSASALSPLDTNLPFATNLDTAISQAQELRKSGRYEDATRVLAQLVIASPDDPRVIGEYGKLMLEAGRLDDATSFLERAVVLQPSDWTLFSALGVAYDQSGQRDHARVMFQRALALSPNETTVLSNLAISHMLAGELDEAERLLLQVSEQRKDIPGVAAKLAMVRNIRTTTGQSRPLSVSTLPQPTVPPTNSANEVTPAAGLPAATDVAPVLQDTSSQEPIEDEFESMPADEVETPEVAAVAPVLPTEAPANTSPTSPIVINEINKTSHVKNVQTATVAEPSQKPAPDAAHSAPAISSKNKEIQQFAEVKLQAKKVPSLKALPISQRASVIAKAPAEQKPAQSPANVSPKMVTAAKRQAPKTAPVLEPIPTQVWVTESKLTQVTAVVPTPEASKVSEQTANPTPQAAVMTRRAPASAVVGRTAPVPLVLLFAPAPVSWESAVRVSLPQAHEAGSQTVVRHEPIETATPETSAGSWGDIVTRWVTAAFGFITAFWA